MEVNKGHGRIERREVWVVGARELGVYLQQEYGWPGLEQVGWARRLSRRLSDSAWQKGEVRTWVSSSAIEQAGPKEIAQSLRGHWTIENGLHWVRDVTWDEDRLHGRAIGLTLATVRNTAINLIRRLGFTFIPDGWRQISARRDHGLLILTSALKN